MIGEGGAESLQEEETECANTWQKKLFRWQMGALPEVQW